jgi:NAD(P)H-dependent flavin oxidoreductase YrpB (nitropropane dioxygenase family)
MIVITVHGRLAHQPEVRMLANGCVCEFRLLSHRFARGAEHVEAATFFVYDEEAEAFCERAEKGQLISATGTQETQRWTDNASGQERTAVKYRLTWWEAGPRPSRSRQIEQVPCWRRPPAVDACREPAQHDAAPARAMARAEQGDDSFAGIV